MAAIIPAYDAGRTLRAVVEETLALFQDLGPYDICRHQVGRALDPLVIQTDDDAERFHQPRLRETGHADEQGVTPGEQRDKCLLDRLMLAENDTPDALSH